jgi:hypothetical protein
MQTGFEDGDYPPVYDAGQPTQPQFVVIERTGKTVAVYMTAKPDVKNKTAIAMAESEAKGVVDILRTVYPVERGFPWLAVSLTSIFWGLTYAGWLVTKYWFLKF